MHNKIHVCALLVAAILVSCNRYGDLPLHCFYNDYEPLKGHVKRSIDSTILFTGGDSLPNNKSLEVKENNFPSDPTLETSTSSTKGYCNIDEADSLFNLTGQFSTDRIRNDDMAKGVTHQYKNYRHHWLKHTEDDYVSSKTGTLLFIDTYKYNDDNCYLLQIDRRNKDAVLLKKYMFYWNHNSVLDAWELYDGNDILIKKATYQYDENNTETGYTVQDIKNKILFSFSFTYHGIDTAGNWHKRIKLKNNKPVAITTRHIEYY
ncbi:MAG: hypothetical protein QM802_04980 [Agriterribacter sp.]